MNKRAETIIMNTLGFEGGYVDNKDDLGGATNFGITEKTAKNHGYDGDMKNFTLEEAIKIYYKSFYKPLRFDEFEDVILAQHVYDMGVNMGTVTTIKLLQESVNLYYEGTPLTVDGKIGPQTLKFVNRVKNDKKLRLIHKFVVGSRYKGITVAREKNETFIFGWLNRINDWN